MPPRSRSSLGPASKGAQKTLAFAPSKITKAPSTAPSKISKSLLSKPLDLGHVSSAPAVAQQAAVELAKPRCAEELAAEKISDAQIKKYWRAREAERKAPRAHQEDLMVEEKILRLFDMSSQFGPAIGIARMKRWVRANKLGLSPPIEVLAVLLKEEKKGNVGIERAYVDELMSSKFLVEV